MNELAKEAAKYAKEANDECMGNIDDIVEYIEEQFRLNNKELEARQIETEIYFAAATSLAFDR